MGKARKSLLGCSSWVVELLSRAREHSTTHMGKGHVEHQRVVWNAEILRNYAERGVDLHQQGQS